MMASLTETETLNALCQILERDQCPWFREELSCAYDYLTNYHKKVQMINGPLSWNDLSKFIGEPVWYQSISVDSKGWIILNELHIKKGGRYVIDTNESVWPFDSYDFFRMKK